MPNIPEGAKRPDDHKGKSEVSDRFSFEHDGQTYTLKPTLDVVTPGFLRKHRRRDEIDAFFTMLEELTDDYEPVTEHSETLDAVDSMSRGEFRQLQKDFFAHLEVQDLGN